MQTCTPKWVDSLAVRSLDESLRSFVESRCCLPDKSYQEAQSILERASLFSDTTITMSAATATMTTASVAAPKMPQTVRIARPPNNADVYQKVQYIMYSAHEVFREGYNNIVKLLKEDVQDDKLKHDVVNFMHYVYSWYYVIDHHHHSEEKTMFVVFNENGVSVEVRLRCLKVEHRAILTHSH